MKKVKIVLILLVIFSGFSFYHFKKENYDIARDLQDISKEEQGDVKGVSTVKFLLPFVKTDFQKKIDRGEKVNFLMLGYGGGEHSGSLLTDTIILSQVDFATGEITMMNIPRDLWVDGVKINAIYAYTGDPNEVVSSLEDLMEVKIDYYLMIDFDGFRKAVDEMAGLEIYVERTFDDYNYPRHDDDQIDPGVMHIHFEEGWETMDGERALQYARSRYSLEDGGDFNRSKRQQKVIEAFREKVMETRDLKTLFTVGKTVSDHFETNFPYVEALSLYKYSEKNEIKIENKILSEENYLYSTYNDYGSYILLPIDNDWQGIGEYFES